MNPSSNFKAITSKRLTTPAYKNPSFNYVRGGDDDYMMSGKAGSYNRYGAANKGFFDNLALFKKV
jgi:hypothetical protein